MGIPSDSLELPPELLAEGQPEPPDAGCYSLPDGSCVSPGPCMHSEPPQAPPVDPRLTALAEGEARVEIPQTAWSVAAHFRAEAAKWLPTCKVQLDKDPTLNIGHLHAQIAEVREYADKVRDTFYSALDLKVALRNDAATCEDQYQRALAYAQQVYADIEAFKKLKSKEERELMLRVLVERSYKAMRETAERLEDWEQFIKQVNVVVFSLNDTRHDIEAQIAVLKVQMFKGELKPNPELGALSGLADILGSDARSFLSSRQPSEPPVVGSGPATPGGAGHSGWAPWETKLGEAVASGKYDDEVSFD